MRLRHDEIQARPNCALLSRRTAHSYAGDRGGSWHGCYDASHLGRHRRARALRSADNATDLRDGLRFRCRVFGAAVRPWNRWLGPRLQGSWPHCQKRRRYSWSCADLLAHFLSQAPPTSMRTSLSIVACQVGVAPSVQCFGVIFAAKDCTAIFPFRTTNVSVASS
jgi:hypothetical protein